LGAAVLGQALAHEGLDALLNLVGILARHQPAGDFHRSARRDHGLGPHPLVAAADAVELQGRPRPNLFEYAVAPLAGGNAEADLPRRTRRGRPAQKARGRGSTIPATA